MKKIIRREWIVNRMRLLSSVFSIDICAYAVMSNHYHICIKINPSDAELWSDEEVAERWALIHKGPLLFQKWRAGEKLSSVERQAVSDSLIIYRKRLQSLSWFMKCLNEPIAKMANAEDKCTGHFWESRFKSQALLTEEALLSCMAYVDLNPIRAKMATTPETSDYTSIKERLRPEFDLQEAIASQIDMSLRPDAEFPLKPLSDFEGSLKAEDQSGILFDFKDYLTLVDFSGRIQREGKRGAIPEHLPYILSRLNITKDSWLANSSNFEALYDKKFRKRRLKTA